MRLSWLETVTNGTLGPEPDVGELERVGVHYRLLKVDSDASQPVLDELKTRNGYIEQDVVELRPDTPNLESICAKFADEHLHDDDEVRYVLEGEGIFDIRNERDRWVRVTVEQGDLIVVPAKLHHRFFLTDKKHIRCVRLFKDASGWTPHYR
jgi:1,2-dihydroxy-3-keto-5-methylthiopentene dioxygenase